MGSEQFDRHPGLKRGSEWCRGAPGQFTVIGVDITADDLKTRYKGTKGERYASDVIDAAVQTQRTAKPPPRTFVDLCRGGVHEPIIVCDIGRDGTKDGYEIDAKGKKKPAGKAWLIVLDGRQRDLALRTVNAQNEEAGRPTFTLSAIFRPFIHASAKLDATLVKVTTAARVPRTPSQRAEDAVALRAQNVADCTGLTESRDEAEVDLLVLLDGCSQVVKDRVDAGEIALADVKEYAKQAPAEQERRAVRKTAGTKKAEKDAAAPPRAKTRPARVLESVEAEARRLLGDAAADEDGFRLAGVVATLAWARGETTMPPFLLRIVDSAEATRKAARS